MTLNLDTYEPSVLLEDADGETEWLTPMEWARLDGVPEGSKVTAFCYAIDAPAGGITDQWRQETGDLIVATLPAATGWDTLDESNDRDLSEFVVDVAGA